METTIKFKNKLISNPLSKLSTHLRARLIYCKGKDESESKEFARERTNQRARRRSLQGKGSIREREGGACKGKEQSESEKEGLAKERNNQGAKSVLTL